MQNDSTETRPFCVPYLQNQARRHLIKFVANERKQKNLVTQILVMPLTVSLLRVLLTTMT